jgi:hypothetical protein
VATPRRGSLTTAILHAMIPVTNVSEPGDGVANGTNSSRSVKAALKAIDIA